jgi:hypothetical protein
MAHALTDSFQANNPNKMLVRQSGIQQLQDNSPACAILIIPMSSAELK